MAPNTGSTQDNSNTQTKDVELNKDNTDTQQQENTEVSRETEATKGVEILNYWYPVCFTKNFPNDRPVPVQLYGEPLVIFRGKNNNIICLQDRCAHRSVPLSIGAWKNGVVECRYHGWQFGEDGKCVRIPSLPSSEQIPKSVKVPSYPATEREGMIWVWPGDPSKCNENEGFPEPAPELLEKGWRILDQTIDQNYGYWNLIENLLDPMHLQFTHEGQQGKNIGSTDESFPELQEYEIIETKAKGGFVGTIRATKTRKPLYFTIEFDPPVTVRLEVSFPNGWKFNQMHYCIPTAEGKTRMLLRSMRNWLKFMPESMFLSANMRILTQDTFVLYAQKLRLDQGASRWNYPVKGDALAIRYRRWRDVVEPRSKPWFKGYVGSSFKKGGGVKRGCLNQSEQKEIEDVPNCCGSCDTSINTNLDLLTDINHQAPDVWPSSKKFKDTQETLKSFATTLWNIVFYGGYLLAVAVAIYTLTKA